MEIDFSKLWERDKKNEKNQQKYWDSRAREFNSRLSENRDKKETELVLSYLGQKGALNKNGSVLDIGCGPGKYALAFAKKVKRVTGTDISPKMIAHAKENAKNSGFENIEFVEASWTETDLSVLGWMKNYDLVYAAFSPGIDGPDALRKMIEASRKHCFISGFVTREERILDGLKRHLGIKITPWGRKIYYSFNLLWNWGYYPEITYHDRSWSSEYDIDRMADIFMTRLSEQASYNRQDVIECLKKLSVSGKVKEQTTSKVAWLYWQV